MAVEFGELISNLPAVFYRCKCDEDWTMYYISEAIESITGYPASDFILNGTRTYTSTIHPDDLQGALDTVDRAVEIKEPWEIEYRMRNKDGENIWVSEKGVAIFSESGELKFLDGFISNIDPRKRIEKELQETQAQVYTLAYTDSITGLANRNLFIDRLERALSYSRRYKTEFVLMFIDLDGFKKVNDTHGHIVGDVLLKVVGQRLIKIFRDSDTIARFGGDEFLVLALNVHNGEGFQVLAGKIIDGLAVPIIVDGNSLSVTGSVGIVISPRDGENSSDLLKKADMAMYRAKSLGKNQCCFYDDSIREEET